MAKQSATALLIDLIIEQELDLSEYGERLPAIIAERFRCLKKVEGHTGTVDSPPELVERVIRWENGEQDCSLEMTLIREFHVEPKKKKVKKP